MKYIVIFPLLTLLCFTGAFAQEECPCCADAYSRFDFWIGDWVVIDTLDNKVGDNSILKIENNCIVSEHWKGVQGGTGSSYSYYDRYDSTWNQLWVDNRGNVLRLKGNSEDGRMVLNSQPALDKRGNSYYHKITWSQNEDGSVTQLWETFDNNNRLINVVFQGRYMRR